ncbi:conserved exported hypothetical protein [Candidatus Sulfotelmatomonas gaucii]|uniref:Uncharacterized protein n=1 Tax=Candidatus Sulfuritelmatomonas gaucii TaxID=2043161 RepID=A0A2N9L2S7_9BACT|nr:conserved exported hypothetical protein [Candidatus Sulfotelmatomonas gaucii]
MIQSDTVKTLPRIPWLLLFLALPAMAGDHVSPPVQAATTYPAVEVHPDEHVAIAVEPYDTKEKGSIFRVDYLGHDVMPVRLIVTNQGDHPISLRDARILFETAEGQRIQAAEPEDVERLMTRKERQGSKIPLPGPLPPIHTKPKGSNKEIEADFDEFEYSALVVEPHTTRAGFLFYDVSGLSNPLVGAKLYVRELRDADGKELFSFEVPFNKYLQSKSSEMN